MTTPGAIGYGVPRDPITDLVRRVEDLERANREMQTLLVNQGSMTVPSGTTLLLSSGAKLQVSSGATVPVIDGSGHTVATLGTVGGVTSVHAQDPASGNTLPLSQLAFGGVGANDGGTPFTQTTINTWQAGPMSITVTCNTGRLLVIVQAAIIVGGAASASEQAVMSWNLSGPTTIAPATNRGVGAGVINGASPVVPGFNLGAGAFFHTGLTPGTYTITDQYQTSINSGTYTGRSMVVIPF